MVAREWVVVSPLHAESTAAPIAIVKSGSKCFFMNVIVAISRFATRQCDELR